MTPEAAAEMLDAARFRQRKIVVLEKMVKVGEAAVKKAAPVKKGTARRSVVGRVLIPGERGVVGSNLSYIRPLVLGSSAHVIYPSSKRALFWKGAAHPVKKVMHPGTKANPFFENGLNDAQPQLEQLALKAGSEFFSGVGR